MKSNLIPRDLESQEDIERFKDRWRASQSARDRLKEIFNARLASLQNQEESIEDMIKPNWEIRQAHMLGQRQSIKEFLVYLDQEVDDE